MLIFMISRRGTAAELQGQLPWSYIPPSAHRMRDNLPEDEDLPPVPVPDYTLHPKYRKACKFSCSYAMFKLFQWRSL